MIRAGKIVFAEESFFIEAQIVRNGAHEPVAKDPAGQPAPIFILEGFDKTGADTGGPGKFFNGNFAQLALAFQAVTKISPGHEPEPVLDESAGALGLEHRDPVGAIGRRRGIPERTIGGRIQCCQTERKVGRERRTAGSGEKNGRREKEGETSLEVKGRKREILEREGATKRREEKSKTVLFDRPSASQFKSQSHAPAPLLTDGIKCKFSVDWEAKQKSRLVGRCGNFRRSIVKQPRGLEGTGIMILGITTCTFVRVVLSLIGIFSGFVVVFGLLAGKRLDGWTVLFLVSTVTTSVTGFLFPFHRFLPSHGVGILSLLVLAIAATRFRSEPVRTA